MSPKPPAAEASTQSPLVRADSSIRVRVVSPDQVRLGATLPLTLELANVGTDTVSLELGGQPVLYDFLVVEEPSGELVWNWRAGRADTIQPVVWYHMLQPNEALTYHAEWDLQNLSGRPVSPGKYLVLGRVPGNASRSYQAPSKPLTIVR